jgi:hypothetical protein
MRLLSWMRRCRLFWIDEWFVVIRPSLIKKSRCLLVPEGFAIVAPPCHSGAMARRHALAQPPCPALTFGIFYAATTLDVVRFGQETPIPKRNER